MGLEISYCSSDVTQLCRADASVSLLFSLCKLTYRQQYHDAVILANYIREYRQLMESISQSSNSLSSLWPELNNYLNIIHTTPDGLAKYRLFTCYKPYQINDIISKENLVQEITEYTYQDEYITLFKNATECSIDIPAIKYPSFPTKVDPLVKTLLINLIKTWGLCNGYILHEYMYVAYHLLNSSNNDLKSQLKCYKSLIYVQTNILTRFNKDDTISNKFLTAVCLIHGALQFLEDDLDNQLEKQNYYASWLAIRTQLSDKIPYLIVTQKYSDNCDECITLYTKIFDFLPELPEEP